MSKQIKKEIYLQEMGPINLDYMRELINKWRNTEFVDSGSLKPHHGIILESEEKKIMKYEDKYIKAVSTGGSLIGTGTSRPVSWGNYFYMGEHKRVLNMWEENLEDAVGKFLLDGLVKVRDYGDVLIVIDDRIPSNYYYNKCCFTGCGKVSLEIAKNIYETLGDPTNELLQFIDPHKYHEIRGGCYNVMESGEAYISYPATNKGRKLNEKWTCEIEQNPHSICGRDILEEDRIIFAPYLPLTTANIKFNENTN
jgi:hypothetical protein